ncbi:hypothetical protein D3C86_1262760 [compost metagenome]
MRVLGQAHRPAHDHPFGPGVHAGGEFDVNQRHARLLLDVLPAGGVDFAQVGAHSRGVFGDERMVEHRLAAADLCFALPLEQELDHAAHHRHVATQGRAEVRGVGRLGAVHEHFDRVLRMLEALQSALLERVDADHLCAALDRFAQRLEHPRVVGAGVLADDEDRIGMLQVVKHHGAFTHAEAFDHAHRAGFVAHVGAVRKVVGAVGPDKQLIEIGGLVAGPARCIKLGLIRRFQSIEVPGDRRERFVPGGFDVAVGGRVITHRVGQAALILQPVIALLGQRRDAVFVEEGRVDQTARGFPVNRLGAVLAELDHAVFRRLAPGATGAIEPAVLVGLEHGANVLQRVFTAQPVLGNSDQRAPTSGGTFIGFVSVDLRHGTSP